MSGFIYSIKYHSTGLSPPDEFANCPHLYLTSLCWANLVRDQTKVSITCSFRPVNRRYFPSVNNSLFARCQVCQVCQASACQPDRSFSRTNRLYLNWFCFNQLYLNGYIQLVYIKLVVFKHLITKKQNKNGHFLSNLKIP